MTEVVKREPVYIIIPVYNRKNITLNCLACLQNQGDLQRYHVVVVDDGSTDETAEAIAAQYPEVCVLSGNGDLWWTGAIAMGMQYAHEQGAEYFFWLNDDCIPSPGTLPGLVEWMRSHPNTIVAPACYVNQDGKTAPVHNGVKGRRGLLANPGEVIFVDGMSGRCVGIPSAVFHKIGPPDAFKFPHYSGDDVYVLRATRSGFQACLVGDFESYLVGEVNETLRFQNYFRSGRTFIETFQALFLHKKSPYRLSTQYFYLTEKYGFLSGIALFMSRLVSWLWKWLRLQLNFSIQS